MKTFVGLLMLFLFALPFYHPTTYACSCAEPPAISDYYQRAEFVFAGEVIEVIDPQLPQEPHTIPYLKIKFKVKRWWKGGNEPEMMLIDQQTTCSPHFEKGKIWLVYIRSGKVLTTTVCDGTLKLEEAEAHLKSLGKGTLPKPLARQSH